MNIYTNTIWQFIFNELTVISEVEHSLCNTRVLYLHAVHCTL